MGMGMVATATLFPSIPTGPRADANTATKPESEEEPKPTSEIEVQATSTAKSETQPESTTQPVIEQRDADGDISMQARPASPPPSSAPVLTQPAPVPIVAPAHTPALPTGPRLNREPPKAPRGFVPVPFSQPAPVVIPISTQVPVSVPVPVPASIPAHVPTRTHTPVPVQIPVVKQDSVPPPVKQEPAPAFTNIATKHEPSPAPKQEPAVSTPVTPIAPMQVPGSIIEIPTYVPKQVVPSEIEVEVSFTFGFYISISLTSFSS